VPQCSYCFFLLHLNRIRRSGEGVPIFNRQSFFFKLHFFRNSIFFVARLVLKDSRRPVFFSLFFCIFNNEDGVARFWLHATIVSPRLVPPTCIIRPSALLVISLKSVRWWTGRYLKTMDDSSSHSHCSAGRGERDQSVRALGSSYLMVYNGPVFALLRNTLSLNRRSLGPDLFLFTVFFVTLLPFEALWPRFPPSSSSHNAKSRFCFF